ncbi:MULTISPECIES: plasmid pRiA4b ORF-3 family protein [unclassified Rathayibacter]|uniref:plasmid pRiA4b ORF-3 family protein n=1 Tax=unclassified Rathayibacter TaxID=2609250 RepID=UPI00188C7DC8|nr:MULTISPECIES: plasmid pRiA4b ORF-3 family protein [unclassified Rathayibacter]MBF4463532.1 plasmid pRiA4b ORF-3 family protein [Rathayibacter sp. VKM Ac-2879]MBF4505018.1 plasmid pRiA4b ORF-3 family protein [Rathayibacter sp. VKM Ac-2878]
MGKKRNQGRSGGGREGGGQGGGRTAETALMVRFRSWYRAHLADVGALHEHLEVDEAVDVLTDLFAMTRDLRPRGSFARPDAELLEAVFDQIEADLSGDESEADLDDTLFTVAEVVEHFLDFLTEEDLWTGTDEELEECQAVLDEVLDLAGSFIDAVLDDLTELEEVPAAEQLAAVRASALVHAADVVVEHLAATDEATLTERAAREIAVEAGIASAGSTPSDDAVRIPVAAWWDALLSSEVLEADGRSAVLGEAAVLWRSSDAQEAAAERVAYVAHFLDLWARSAQAGLAAADTENGAFTPEVRAITITDAVLVRMAVACQASMHPGLVVGELIDELAADSEVLLEEALDERERMVGAAERMLDDAAELGLLLHSPEFGYTVPDALRPVIASVVRASILLLGAREASRLEILDEATDETAAAYALRVAVLGTKPAVWRTLELSSESTLRDLHLAVQLALGWSDAQPHYFSVGVPDEDHARIGSPSDAEELGSDLVDEASVVLAEVLNDVADELFYVYDLEDEWRHVIRLEAIAPLRAALPRCTGARGAAPLDASGGPAAWADTVRAATDPSSADHAEALEALGLAPGASFDPAAVDIDAINRSLGLLRTGL